MSSFEISVIIPTYNSCNVIERCVDSILDSIHPHQIEIIIINDGSTDNTAIVLEKYVNYDNIKVLHTKNYGVSRARNIGIINSIGKWITFVDSDDYVTENWMIDYDKINLKAQLIVQGFESDNWRGQGHKYITLDNSLITKNEICNFLDRLEEIGAAGYIWNKMFLNDIIKEQHIRFDENIHLREDMNFFLHYMQYVTVIQNFSNISYKYFCPEEKRYKSQNDLYVNNVIYDKLSIIYPQEKFYKSIYYKELMEVARDYIIDQYAYNLSDTLSKKEILIDYIKRYPNSVKLHGAKYKLFSVLESSNMKYMYYSLYAFYVLKKIKALLNK